MEFSKDSIKATFAYLSEKDASVKVIPIEEFREAFERFIKELKYIVLKKVTYFIYENWTKIEKECKEREMTVRYDDDDHDYKGKDLY